VLKHDHARPKHRSGRLGGERPRAGTGWRWTCPTRRARGDQQPLLSQLQRRHFFLYDILPLCGTVLAIGWAHLHPITALDVGLFFLMWALTGFAISIGFHRMFCHRAFKAGTAVRATLLILGCMAARSSVITWVAQHRRHHELADHEGDAHSPNLHGRSLSGRLRGWFYSHVSWMRKHEYPNVVRYAPDLMGDRLIVRLDKKYTTWVLLGLLLPAALGGLLSQSLIGAVSGLLWGGLVRLFVVSQQVSAVNSLNHILGTRPFKMPDNWSHNIALFGLLTWGEGWHNNHHAFPIAANFGFRWYHIDPGYYVIRTLELLGLATDVRRPNPLKVEALRRRLDEAPVIDSGELAPVGGSHIEEAAC
jgi:stearoyl-CoA desaturase (delta-9 desaturase)